MIIPIERVIGELQRIPRATWHVGDPAVPPVLRPRERPRVTPGSYNPVFDDTGFTDPASPLWEEAIAAVAQRVSPPENSGHDNRSVGADALAWYASFHNLWDLGGFTYRFRVCQLLTLYISQGCQCLVPNGGVWPGIYC
jgi:hypothetical protein